MHTRPLTLSLATGACQMTQRGVSEREKAERAILMSESSHRASRSLTAHCHHKHFLLHVILFVLCHYKNSVRNDQVIVNLALTRKIAQQFHTLRFTRMDGELIRGV